MRTKDLTYPIKLVMILAMLSTGITSVITKYVPEQKIKDIVRKRRRIRRFETLSPCDEEV